MEIHLLKVHGSGNLFYLVETADEKLHDWIRLAKWLCCQDNNDGADGLLLVAPSQIADAKMRVINADGSEASMCGNGLRCVARYICEKFNKTEAIIETMKANLRVKKDQPIFEELPTYSVEISPLSFKLESLPMNYREKEQVINEIIDDFSPVIRFTAVSVPNAHLIGAVTKHYIQRDTHQCQLAQYLNEKNAICHDGVNVSYMYPVQSNSIYVRTYERGVGFTNACGTAMTAAAVVAKMTNLVTSEEIIVYNPGGFVKCTVKNDGGNYELLLTGNATITEYCLLQANTKNYQWIICEQTTESVQYEKCINFVKEHTAQFIL